MSKAMELLLNALFPPKCAFCSVRLPIRQRICVCAECSDKLPYCRTEKRCSHCGKPAESGGMCKACLLRRNYTAGITSPFVYKERAKDAVVAFKKRDNAYRGRTLSLFVAEMVRYDFGGVDFDGVVSVPPRRSRMNEEKYDQAECLARHTARRLGLTYYPNVMRQVGDMQKQSTLSHDARFDNVRGGFAVRRPDRIKGKTLLLIDDVCTTGATLEECARVLRESGAHRVYAATIATTLL